MSGGARVWHWHYSERSRSFEQFDDQLFTGGRWPTTAATWLIGDFTMHRRKVIKLLGVSALGSAVVWSGRRVLLPPARGSNLDSVDNLASRLVDSFDPATRAAACVEYEHPFRQYHNRGVFGGGVSGWSLNWDQRQILTDLLYAGLSEQGRSRIPDEFFLNLPGIHAVKVVVCGNPKSPPYQIVLTGPHVNLRLGGTSREGVAFGGPQVYGDQRGNEKQGLPGNIYRYQFEAGHRLFASLTLQQQRLALQPIAPIQTQIELAGIDGQFVGIPVATLSDDSKALARSLVNGIMSTYATQDAAYAWRCIESNGGLDELHLSYYADGEVDRSGQYQIFRLEGPAAVLYFRGYPHVHAFINVAMNPAAPLSVGSIVGENAAVREGSAVKTLFEQAMRTQTGSDLAYYPLDGVVGRLRIGGIRTGDIYNLESWQDAIVVGEIEGSRVPSEYGFNIDPKRSYVMATIREVARELSALRGVEQRAMLRDATIAHARQHGFA